MTSCPDRFYPDLMWRILDLPVPQFALITAGAVCALVVAVQILLATIVPGQSYVKAEHGTMNRFLEEYVRVIWESHPRPCTVKFESFSLQLKSTGFHGNKVSPRFVRSISSHVAFLE